MGPQKRLAIVLLAGGLAAGATYFLLASLANDARFVASVAIFGLVLWLTESLPLHVTGLLVTLLLVAFGGHDPKLTFASYFDPVIVLLLGGFALGRALQAHSLDHYLARIVLRVSGTKPRAVMLALMLLTAVLSMWISNTAATAVVLPIGVSLIASAGLPKGAPFAKAFVLGIAFAASLGGIATPIGSTPNPIALRFLREEGVVLSFGEWMLLMAPIALVLVLATWLLLGWAQPAGSARIVAPAAIVAPKRGQWSIMGIFGLTVLLWLTEPLHGQSAAVVALVPIVILFASGLLRKEDFHHLGWDVLILIGASIALGDAIRRVGLDGVIADQFARAAAGMSPLVLFAVLALVAIALTTLVSNTAAAIVLIPPLLPFAQNVGLGVEQVVLVAVVGVSADLLVPMGTPPNAMAYATGHVRIVDMIRAGAPIALLAVLVAALAGWAYW